MKRSFRPAVLGIAACVAVLARPAIADEVEARRAEVVAKVGPTVITVGDVERRMRVVPAFQLASLGKSPDEIRRAFVEQVLVPEALYSVAARARKIDDDPGVRAKLVGALASARDHVLLADAATHPPTPEEIARYYDENRFRYDSPERVTIWRILCKSRDEAVKVLADAKRTGAPARWRELAREHSIDLATNQRDGSLGFVAPDGVSNEPGVRVDPAVVTAARGVKDGELVAEPVAEGPAFAVVWRRGTLPAVKRTLEQESRSIREMLVRQHRETARKELIQKLREAHLRDVSLEALDALEIDGSGAVGPHKRPGVAPRKPTGPAAPSQGPDGLR